MGMSPGTPPQKQHAVVVLQELVTKYLSLDRKGALAKLFWEHIHWDSAGMDAGKGVNLKTMQMGKRQAGWTESRCRAGWHWWGRRHECGAEGHGCRAGWYWAGRGTGAGLGGTGQGAGMGAGLVAPALHVRPVLSCHPAWEVLLWFVLGIK